MSFTRYYGIFSAVSLMCFFVVWLWAVLQCVCVYKRLFLTKTDGEKMHTHRNMHTQPGDIL